MFGATVQHKLCDVRLQINSLSNQTTDVDSKSFIVSHDGV